MKILTAQQHGQLDAATMQRFGIDREALMNRACDAFVEVFLEHYRHRRGASVFVACGPGNNGGDGHVIAKKLRFLGFEVSDPELREDGPVFDLTNYDLIIDALFGTGLSRPVEGFYASVIEAINLGADAGAGVIAVDLPSGLRADGPNPGPCVRAQRTISLGYPKMALFAAENAEFLGDWKLAAFEIDDTYIDKLDAKTRMLTRSDVAALRRPRAASDHKGTFGHALLVAGSYGSMGAALLCARAALRAGLGLLTVHAPAVGYPIIQLGAPEAMFRADDHDRHFATAPTETDRYATIGVGPGLGQHPDSLAALRDLLARANRPMVLDADALNLVAANPELFDQIPSGSILTPHPKEFERLFGKKEDSFARWALQRRKAHEHDLVIVLKTNHTAVATPDGYLYLNTTGNPGMGTGGTGDVLTGIITGLLAQRYVPGEAARLGVYLHGLAGDLVAEEKGQEALLAGDLVDHLGAAFRHLVA